MTNQDTLMQPEEKSRRRHQELDRIYRETGNAPQSWRVMVLTPGDTDWVGNGMRYPLPGLAQEAAESLAWRWTAVRDTLVLPSEDAPNAER